MRAEYIPFPLFHLPHGWKWRHNREAICWELGWFYYPKEQMDWRIFAFVTEEVLRDSAVPEVLLQGMCQLCVGAWNKYETAGKYFENGSGR